MMISLKLKYVRSWININEQCLLSILLFRNGKIFHFTSLCVSRFTHRLMTELLLKSTVEKLSKKSSTASLRYYNKICRERLWKATKHSSHDDCYLGRDLNLSSPNVSQSISAWSNLMGTDILLSSDGASAWISSQCGKSSIACAYIWWDSKIKGRWNQDPLSSTQLL